MSSQKKNYLNVCKKEQIESVLNNKSFFSKSDKM